MTLGKQRILVVGAGDVGKRLIPLLVPHYRVFALTTNPQNARQLRLLGAVPIIGDLDDRPSLARLNGLAQHVFHFAPPPSQGKHDPRTAHLLSILAGPQRASVRSSVQRSVRTPVRITYISTTGVYGDCAGARIDETRSVNPTNARALRRVAAERALRVATARRSATAAILRVPGIYAADRLPTERLARGTPALREADDVYTNHIHADDLAYIARAAMWRARPNRVYHASDDSELKMGDYFDLVASAFNLPKPERIGREEAPARLSPMLLSFMQESRRLVNTRIKRELGVRLRYPSVVEGVAAAVGA